MSNSTLEEVKKRVFLGTVPVKVEIDTLDIPLCFNVPRSIPLSLFFYSKLGSEIGEKCDNFCIFVNKTDPIQPHIPAGVIYDSYFPPKSGFQPLSVFINTQNNTPTLRQVLQCPTEQVASHYFCHLFKESLFLTSGNLSLLQQNINMHLRIQQAALKQEYDDNYIALREILEENNLQRQYWPVKVYQKGERMKQCFAKVEPDSKQTLADVLSTKEISAETVIIQGIEVDTKTLMTDIVSSLIYPDGFLYVTLK